MIIGANTNVLHRGVTFHVQTEDSGRANPHVISHLYHHGTILASEKTDYSDKIEAQNLEEVVRGLIDAQHKSMLKRLRAGDFDAAISQRLGDKFSGAQEAPTPLPDDTPSPVPAAALPEPAPARSFGDGIVSQKPLDEVILEYLARKARDRASGRADASGRKTRPRE